MLKRSEAQELNPEREMPFTDHLEELRWHLLRSILYVVLFAGFAWYRYDLIYHLIATPVHNAFAAANYQAELVYLDILEPLMFRLQVVLAAAVILALPLIILEVWRFVGPGLYREERRFVAPLLPFSILLCFLGFTLVYYALPIAFRFLLQFAPPTGEAQVMQHLQKYYFFLLRMMIGAGITFQTPIIVLLLGQLEIVTARGLVQYWRHAILVCFVVAAIITPTIDPFNMAIIALPLCGLYLLSVVLVWRLERKRARQRRREAPTSDEPSPALAPPPTPAAPADVVPLAPTPAAQPTPLEPTPPVVDRSAMGPLAGQPPALDDDDEASFDPSRE